MSSTTTAVDLSQLTAPDLIETLDYEAILAGLVADLRARDASYSGLVESDPAMKLLEVCAYRILLERQRVNDVAKSLLVAYATGADLDHLAALFGVGRLAGESDAALRQRIVLAPESYSVAGPEAAYVFHARTASPLVADASATSPAPGEVVVSVLSSEGNGAASGQLVAAVATIVNADGIRPLTDHVTVQSAEIVDYAIDATIYTFAGPDSTLIIDQGTAALAAYQVARRRLGQDVTASGIMSALHVAGVQRVVLNDWEDVVIGDTEAAHCTSVSITFGGYAQ
jgi:phage-related baseplate assembly protein